MVTIKSNGQILAYPEAQASCPITLQNFQPGARVVFREVSRTNAQIYSDHAIRQYWQGQPQNVPTQLNETTSRLRNPLTNTLEYGWREGLIASI